MSITILELGKQFRPGTSHVYPPFKNGLYMEEYVYQYLMEHHTTLQIKSNLVYLPIFWTNLQNHPGFSAMKKNYNLLLQKAFRSLSPDTQYVTVVQHDDGPQLDIPPNTIIFGACTGTIPIPLLYEDCTHRLLTTPRCEKDILASFIGTHTTHDIRRMLIAELTDKPGIICSDKSVWSASVAEQDADLFMNTTLRSKFCLAPRGYGRSSFRFFEAMQLDTVPVYFWDDKEWLPYQDILDYSLFSVSIHKKDIHCTYDILSSITEKKYIHMLEEIKKVRHYFTLKGMCEYIAFTLQRI